MVPVAAADERLRTVGRGEPGLSDVREGEVVARAGIDAICDYAGRVSDYQCAHPELARLTFWEGLELGGPVAKEHGCRASRRHGGSREVALRTLAERSWTRLRILSIIRSMISSSVML